MIRLLARRWRLVVSPWTGPLLAGGLLSLLVAGLSPLNGQDPFRTTLAFLPLVVAGLVTVDRWAGLAGGRALSATLWRRESLALLALVFLIAGRQRLGLLLADGVLAAALLVLLAVHLGHQLVALRPLLGRRLPRTPSAIFFVLPLLTYLAILPWSTTHRPPDGDEPWYLLLTHSLAHDFDVDLRNNYEAEDWRHFVDREDESWTLEPQPGDPRGAGGEIYSRHTALLPAVLAPAYRLAGKYGALAAMALLTAAVAYLFLRLSFHYTPAQPGGAFLAYSTLAFAPPLLLYSYQVWVEVPAALLVVLALERLASLKARVSPRLVDWGLCVLPMGLLPLLKLRFGLLAGPLVALLVWSGLRGSVPRRPVLAVAGIVAGAAAALLGYNQLRYGNPLKMYQWRELELFRHSPADTLEGLLGLFYDPAFGLFGCAPIWLLLLPAGLLLLLRRHRLLVEVAVVAAPYLLMVAPRREWYGGWSPPFRYPLVLLPLLALVLVPLLERTGGRRKRGLAPTRSLVATLAVVTLVLAVLWVVVPGWTYNLAHGRSHLADHLEQRLGADVSRFLPSLVRPRLATWIWPPLSLAVVLACWLPRRRRAAGTPAPAAGDWGLAAGLLCLAALPLAATRLPTETVEFESPSVSKSGGEPHPGTWVVDRRRFREGWTLHCGDEVRTLVNPGGEWVAISVVGQSLEATGPGGSAAEPRTVEVRSGPHRLWRQVVSTRDWRVSFGPVTWRGDEPLVVTLVPDSHCSGGIVLDRAKLHWL